MALKILKEGTDISEMPVEKANEFELQVNEEMASALGIDTEQLKKGE